MFCENLLKIHLSGVKITIPKIRIESSMTPKDETTALRRNQAMLGFYESEYEPCEAEHDHNVRDVGAVVVPRILA